MSLPDDTSIYCGHEYTLVSSISSVIFFVLCTCGGLMIKFHHSTE